MASGGADLFGAPPCAPGVKVIPKGKSNQGPMNTTIPGVPSGHQLMTASSSSSADDAATLFGCAPSIQPHQPHQPHQPQPELNRAITEPHPSSISKPPIRMRTTSSGSLSSSSHSSASKAVRTCIVCKECIVCKVWYSIYRVYSV